MDFLYENSPPKAMVILQVTDHTVERKGGLIRPYWTGCVGSDLMHVGAPPRGLIRHPPGNSLSRPIAETLPLP